MSDTSAWSVKTTTCAQLVKERVSTWTTTCSLSPSLDPIVHGVSMASMAGVDLGGIVAAEEGGEGMVIQGLAIHAMAGSGEDHLLQDSQDLLVLYGVSWEELGASALQAKAVESLVARPAKSLLRSSQGLSQWILSKHLKSRGELISATLVRLCQAFCSHLG